MIVTINNYLVDFEAPIWMSENQRVKFIAFFKNLFSETKVINIKEPEKKVRYSERRIKHWSPKEYSLLFTPKTNEELAEELGRSEMSVNMQRAEFLPEFIN